jgi:hypothetical protein
MSPFGKPIRNLRPSTFSAAAICLGLFLLCACTGGKEQGEETGKRMPAAYSEGDTLELDPFPKNLQEWMTFYGSHFPGFRNGNFKASGIVLHFDSLPLSQTPPPGPDFRPFLPYAEDGLHYIDLLSYNTSLSRDSSGMLTASTGDPDQEVVLGDEKSGRRYQLLYNGPGQSVESADWLGNDEFLLTLLHTDEKQGAWIPEIRLYSRKDSTFTHFLWTRTIPSDSLNRMGSSFTDQWFRARKVNVQ